MTTTPLRPLTYPSEGLADQPTLADRIAAGANALYERLPRHGKPVLRPNGVPEWTILAAISLVRPDDSILPISLGTGVKVIPASKLPPLGDTVHDCHAEILARRGFIRWLMEEARRIATGEHHEGVLEWVDGSFKLKGGVRVCLYVSTIPCGDASTLYTAACQEPEMAARWTSATSEQDLASEKGVRTIRGREGYGTIGAIRTKPGRADSVPSISLSCSDKIASWSVLGIQGGLLANLFEPVYLHEIIVGGVEENPPAWYDTAGRKWWDIVRSEIERSIWGRLESLQDALPEPYRLHRPKVSFTSTPFSHSKQSVAARYPDEEEPGTSGLSISCLPWRDAGSEIIFNGCRAGPSWKAPGHTLLKDRSRSRLCGFEILKAYVDLSDRLTTLAGASDPISPSMTYFDLKRSSSSLYQQAKRSLRGKPAATEQLGESFGQIGSFDVTVREENCTAVPPFEGWIVSGKKYQSFTREGELGQSKVPL